jgi:hypothetical protein
MQISDKIAPVMEISYCFMDEIYMVKTGAIKRSPPVLSGGPFDLYYLFYLEDAKSGIYLPSFVLPVVLV